MNLVGSEAKDAVGWHPLRKETGLGTEIVRATETEVRRERELNEEEEEVAEDVEFKEE